VTGLAGRHGTRVRATAGPNSLRSIPGIETSVKRAGGRFPAVVGAKEVRDRYGPFHPDVPGSCQAPVKKSTASCGRRKPVVSARGTDADWWGLRPLKLGWWPASRCIPVGGSKKQAVGVTASTRGCPYRMYGPRDKVGCGRTNSRVPIGTLVGGSPLSPWQTDYKYIVPAVGARP